MWTDITTLVDRYRANFEWSKEKFESDKHKLDTAERILRNINETKLIANDANFRRVHLFTWVTDKILQHPIIKKLDTVGLSFIFSRDYDINSEDYRIAFMKLIRDLKIDFIIRSMSEDIYTIIDTESVDELLVRFKLKVERELWMLHSPKQLTWLSWFFQRLFDSVDNKYCDSNKTTTKLPSVNFRVQDCIENVENRLLVIERLKYLLDWMISPMSYNLLYEISNFQKHKDIILNAINLQGISFEDLWISRFYFERLCDVYDEFRYEIYTIDSLKASSESKLLDMNINKSALYDKFMQVRNSKLIFPRLILESNRKSTYLALVRLLKDIINPSISKLSLNAYNIEWIFLSWKWFALDNWFHLEDFWLTEDIANSIVKDYLQVRKIFEEDWLFDFSDLDLNKKYNWWIVLPNID